MDKNMIHIDELVKQRLSGGEEREIPGSWLRMRDLLDQEMPEKKRVAGYYNWRRMFGVMTGLVLLSALTVGSYNLVNSSRLNAGSDHAIAVANTRTRLSAPAGSAVQNGGHVAERVAARQLTNGNSNATAKESRQVSSVYTANRSTGKPGNVKGDINKLTPVAGGAIVSSGNLHPTASIPASHTPADLQQPDASLQMIAATSKKAELMPASATNTPNIATARSLPSHTIVSAADNNGANEAKGNNNQPRNTDPVSSNNLITAATADNTRLKPTPAPIQPNLPKDTLNKMQIVQRLTVNPLTRESRITLDTVAIERMIVDRTQEAGADAIAAANSNVSAINPAASPAAVADMAASESLVPLSNFKIQSRKTSRWNARSFDEVVRDVKFNLSQTKFFPGISAGGNTYMFGQNNFSGFQLGLFGLFTFGETWSAMGELKYIHRFNSGATLSDNYIDVVQKQGSYLQGNVEHFFKFTSLQSIEMPLALRFAAGRLNLFGGLNLAYHFAVNADEQTLRPADTAYSSFNNPGGKLKVRPGVTYEDFRARFAVGGLLGISYELLPSLQLDFRATKNLWDNAYGLGAEQVSSQLYNAPSVQFSIFYRFSQKNQIPKAK